MDLLHRLVSLHVIEEHFVALRPGKIKGVHEEGRFTGIVERLLNVDLVHELVIDGKRDVFQVATDADVVDRAGRRFERAGGVPELPG